jgi:hypothetical protein
VGITVSTIAALWQDMPTDVGVEGVNYGSAIYFVCFLGYLE